MEVIRKTPLATVRADKEELARKQGQIVELSKAKETLENDILNLSEVSATLYEENVALREQNLDNMLAIAELYEMVTVGGA